MLDVAGRDHFAADIDHGGNDWGSGDGAETLGVVDTVLKTENRRLRAQGCGPRRTCFFGIGRFTKKSTKSGEARELASVPALAGKYCLKTCVSKRRPCALIASTCVRLPINVTSCPALASRPP